MIRIGLMRRLGLVWALLACLASLTVAPAAFAQDPDVLAISGKIDPAMRYRVRIDYATTVNDRSCQFDDQITGMWIRQLESRFESPKIVGDTHSLRVSLARPAGVGACNWQPSVLYLCVGSRDTSDEGLSCRSLLLVTPFAAKAPEQLSLTCDAKTWTCVTPDKRAPTRQVSGLGGAIELDLQSDSLQANPQAAPSAGRRFLLPDEIGFPEGIAYDPKAQAFYTAGSADGVIAQVDVRTGKARVLRVPELTEQIGTAGTGILGMNVDDRGRLWLAGGRTGKLFVVDPKTSRLITVVEPPEAAQGLINDVAFARGRAFFTDTFRPTLWSVPAGANIAPRPEAWLKFDGTPLVYDKGANLNGIAASASGRTLITGQMNKGLLFAIDTATRKVRQIDLGGEAVEGVDGLVLRGQTLYVIRQPQAEIVRIELSPGFASGRVVSRSKVPGLLWPATAALVGDELLVVNTQFDKRSGVPERPFSVQRIRLSELGQ